MRLDKKYNTYPYFSLTEFGISLSWRKIPLLFLAFEIMFFPDLYPVATLVQLYLVIHISKRFTNQTLLYLDCLVTFLEGDNSGLL